MIRYISLLLFIGLAFWSCEEDAEPEPDTTPPTVSISSHSSGQSVNEIITITVTTHDNEGISKVEFFIDDSLVLTDTESPYQYEWNTTQYEDGEHIVKVISYDNSDNSTTSQPIMLIINNHLNANHWFVEIENLFQLDGFARDISILGNTAFVAAGQYGIQVWDLQSQAMSAGFTGYEEGGSFLEFDDLAIIGRDEINKLIFVSEPEKDVKIFHYDGGDSIFYRNTIMSAKTKGFVSFPSATDQFIMYTADNDDGMKWHFLNLDTTNIFDIEFIEWTPYGGGEIYTPGKLQGIDPDGESYIAMAVDQLGVELYSIDSLGADPSLVGRVDTDGNAVQVKLVSDGVFASCKNVGAYYVPFLSFTSDTNESYNFARSFDVNHISIFENIAILSLEVDGIALYDITDKRAPIFKGLFNIGYVFKTEIWGQKVIACTQGGLSILSIQEN